MYTKTAGSYTDSAVFQEQITGIVYCDFSGSRYFFSWIFVLFLRFFRMKFYFAIFLLPKYYHSIGVVLAQSIQFLRYF